MNEKKNIDDIRKGEGKCNNREEKLTSE